MQADVQVLARPSRNMGQLPTFLLAPKGVGEGHDLGNFSALNLLGMGNPLKPWAKEARFQAICWPQAERDALTSFCI